MTCQHLKQLYQLCQDNHLKIASSDVIRFVCRECEEIEVCPSMLTDEYEAREADSGDSTTNDESQESSPK
jgi:hypothetical protein